MLNDAITSCLAPLQPAADADVSSQDCAEQAQTMVHAIAAKFTPTEPPEVGSNLPIIVLKSQLGFPGRVCGEHHAVAARVCWSASVGRLGFL